MTTLIFIFLIVSVFCIYQLGAIFLNGRETRRLRDIRYRSLTQHSFGVARQELMLLAGRNEISSKSITFLFFYLMNTKIMRHPDKYKNLSRMLHKSFLDDSHNTDAQGTADILQKESKNWSPNVKKMVFKNISAMNSLMVLHSPLLRTVYTGAMLILPLLKRIVSQEVGLFTSTAKIIAKGSPTMKTFVDTKTELQQLAGSA